MNITEVEGFKSLADIVGFPRGDQNIRLGELPEDGERTLSEAVVAVPYYIEKDKVKFFELNMKQLEKALAKATEDIDPAISHQTEMMKKYIFPPQLDFLKYPEKKAVAMYVFEFEHKLSKQDVADIWQNLPPTIGVNARGWKEGDPRGTNKTEVTVGHTLQANNRIVDPLNGEFKEKTRWMVFKVKKKAETNYYKKLADSLFRDKPGASVDVFKQSRREHVIASTIEDLDSRHKYSFNWPHDFFSLVELIKLTAEVELE